MSRDIPPPNRPRKTRSLAAALDDFAAEKKTTGTRFPVVLIGLAVVGLAGTVGAGLYVFAHADELSSARDDKSKIGYVSMDEIKENANKSAGDTAKAASGSDAPRADARSGTVVIDGIRARVVSIEIERQYQVGVMIYRRKTPVLKASVGFQVVTPGRTQPYEYDPDKFLPVAKLRDEIGRSQPDLNLGPFGKPFSGMLRADKEEIYPLYFEPPTKTRPLDLDCWHPTLGKGKPFRFHIPASMYDVTR